MIDVPKDAIVVFADLGCPWAHAAVYRLHAARAAHGLEDEISFDIRAFPLELLNRQPTPKKTLDAEVPVVAGAVPEAGWSSWDEPEFEYPVTMLPGMEAVYAAKAQGLGLSDRLDRELRVAFFERSRCISIHSEIMSVAAEVKGLDTKWLEEDLMDGSYRRAIFRSLETAQRDEVKGSPHVFLRDGSDHHNPGIEMEWNKSVGFPVIHSDDPEVYDRIIRVAADQVEG